MYIPKARQVQSPKPGDVFQPAPPQGPLPIGREFIFLSIIPYILITSLQYQSARTALIASTATAGFLVAFGLVLYALEARQVRFYILDAALLVVCAVQLGVSFIREDDISNNLDFITNGGLAVLGLLTVVLGYPFTVQHLREAVPRTAWRCVSIRNRAFLTTALFLVVFVTNTLLYLIPVAKNLLNSPTDPLNYVFRIILPILFVVMAAIVTRFATGDLGQQTQQSAGFDGSLGDAWGQAHPLTMPGVTKVMVNPLAQP